ncbi:putative dolichyl-phosphate-mannose--protein mannosyltransferase NDAI_0C04210 [Naumovozyma dairenensis CBS 421]|uniref:dolichyl-phosphate-mannose--protein mannosyltransferase n=1 Tax=Naumovozyma dairenensis (strain ATCC 10597 / BCRC 20456 / CBS 421 / NBRC 0211 / NRRL Y-12639) TaxID=1071378 RepID=G0W8H0_NAUDC|nr:hypothetical protein NDAI_0C04210 [Naumovozyma dairenensis CBS 421]CCD24081.1 hypothetical protein NDAI_0C04210 [Naumovozyma dairenensis CBS 421]
MEGPFRKFIPSNLYRNYGIGKLNTLDYIISLLIPLICYLINYQLLFQERSYNLLTPNEKDLYQAITYYKEKKFFLNEHPLLGIQLYSLLSNNIKHMTWLSSMSGLISLSFVYLTQRKMSNSTLISTLGALSISILPVYQSELSMISLNTIQWFFLSITLFSMTNMLSSKQLSKNWYYHLLALSVSLGCNMSTKLIGIMTWFFIFFVICKHSWQLITDIRISTYEIMKYIIITSLSLIIIPVSIFLGSYFIFLNNSQTDSVQFSSMMSPFFQSYLREPTWQPTELLNGTVIQIRHSNMQANPSASLFSFSSSITLGEYLTTRNNSNYPEGSNEQIVSLTNDESNPETHWILEFIDNPLRTLPSSLSGLLSNETNHENEWPLEDLQKIRIRNKLTGKLLRSSSAKAPVSEQEYNSEISCTGDSSYLGDSDETWQVDYFGMKLSKNIRKKKRRDGFEGALIIPPRISLLKLDNVGQGCTLLGHDTKLPEWGQFNQEVICIRSPNLERTLFQFIPVEKYNSPSSSNDNKQFELVSFLDIVKNSDKKNIIHYYLRLVSELLEKQYKYNYFVRLEKVKDMNTYDEDADNNHLAPEKWAFHTFSHDESDNFGLLGNIIWLSSIVGIITFIINVDFQIMKWNPWKKVAHTPSINKLIYYQFGIECLFGWFIHFYIFTKSPHQILNIELYFPSFLFGYLLFTETISRLYNWSVMKSSIIMVLYYGGFYYLLK